MHLFRPSLNNELDYRQLNQVERDWAKTTASDYQNYLKQEFGVEVSREEAYQRLLSAGYAMTDDAASKTGKSDELAKRFINERAGGNLFNATADERANPLLNGNADGSYTPEQQARWGTQNPGSQMQENVSAALEYGSAPCTTSASCGEKVDAYVKALQSLKEVRQLYQDDASSVALIDSQIEQLKSNITADELGRGAAQSVSNIDKAIVFSLLSSPSRFLTGTATETVTKAVVVPSGANGGVAGMGSVADANFAQSTIRASEIFSKDGIAKYSQLAGRPINTVDDLVAALNIGAIKPSQLPLDYVVATDGTKLILNTRTSVALDRAGVPKSDWYGTNKTGVSVPDMPGKTFDDLAADQLKNNKLPPTGTPTMPKGKK